MVEASNLQHDRPHLPRTGEIIRRLKNQVESPDRRMHLHDKPAVLRKDPVGGGVFVS